MSTHTKTLTKTSRLTTPNIRAMKGRARIVSLTAYTTPIARMMDPLVDMILVGDSLGMVAYGMQSTLPVTLEMMINHGRAVMRGAARACVIIDMPFSSYQESPQQAYRNAARIMQETEAQGIKLEGGREMLDTVAFLVARGIPVIPHVGLMPQHLNIMGGYKYQGRTASDIEQLINLSKAFEACGGFALLVEGTSEDAARQITEALTIPTIGIGASPACDGQILVSDDLLGLTTDTTDVSTPLPRFVKQYAQLSEPIQSAFAQYAHEVRAGEFPTLAHCFSLK